MLPGASLTYTISPPLIIDSSQYPEDAIDDVMIPPMAPIGGYQATHPHSALEEELRACLSTGTDSPEDDASMDIVPLISRRRRGQTRRVFSSSSRLPASARHKARNKQNISFEELWSITCSLGKPEKSFEELRLEAYVQSYSTTNLPPPLATDATVILPPLFRRLIQSRDDLDDGDVIMYDLAMLPQHMPSSEARPMYDPGHAFQVQIADSPSFELEQHLWKV